MDGALASSLFELHGSARDGPCTLVAADRIGWRGSGNGEYVGGGHCMARSYKEGSLLRHRHKSEQTRTHNFYLNAMTCIFALKNQKKIHLIRL